MASDCACRLQTQWASFLQQILATPVRGFPKFPWHHTAVTVLCVRRKLTGDTNGAPAANPARQLPLNRLRCVKPLRLSTKPRPKRPNANLPPPSPAPVGFRQRSVRKFITQDAGPWRGSPCNQVGRTTVTGTHATAAFLTSPIMAATPPGSLRRLTQHTKFTPLNSAQMSSFSDNHPPSLGSRPIAHWTQKISVSLGLAGRLRKGSQPWGGEDVIDDPSHHSRDQWRDERMDSLFWCRDVSKYDSTSPDNEPEEQRCSVEGTGQTGSRAGLFKGEHDIEPGVEPGKQSLPMTHLCRVITILLPPTRGRGAILTPANLCLLSDRLVNRRS
ncbi:hypothetical protein Bbelb_346440 [Branchiostoma belcheri]|nr:hypothetical protein Bbelb_346440 [Branchiostoma belcheri]